MSPPEFNDIGKAGKDILSGKEVDLNKTKFVYKASTTSGAEVTGTLEKGNDASLLGEIKCKFHHSDSKLTFTDTVKSDNSISAKIEAPHITDGLKLDAEFGFNSDKAKETKFGLSYKGSSFAFTSAYNVFQHPKFTGDLVVESHNILVGGQASYDVSNQTVDEFKAAVAYSEEDFTVSVLAEKKLTNFTVGYSQKVNRDVSVAGQATWKDSGSLATSFAAKYSLPGGGILLSKFNSAGVLSFGYLRKIHPSVKLTLGIEFNTAAAQDNPHHKYGFGLTFEPK